MLDHVLVSGRSSMARRSWPVLLASMTIHLGALCAVLVSGFLAVGSISEPDLRQVVPRIFLPKPPAPPAAPLPRGVTTRPSKPEREAEPARPAPEELIQPEIRPEEIPVLDADDEFLDDAFDDGEPGAFGVPWGDPLGDPNGSPLGVPGGRGKGDPNGILEGLGAGDGEPGPIYMTGEVSRPVQIYRVEPEYPAMARRARAEGKVILEIVVNRDGDVEEVRVLRGHPLFDGPAVEAIRQWRYRPALQSGQPVKVYMTVVVDFKLK